MRAHGRLQSNRHIAREVVGISGFGIGVQSGMYTQQLAGAEAESSSWGKILPLGLSG